jgi:hypothetical protein
VQKAASDLAGASRPWLLLSAVVRKPRRRWRSLRGTVPVCGNAEVGPGGGEWEPGTRTAPLCVDRTPEVIGKEIRKILEGGSPWMLVGSETWS